MLLDKLYEYKGFSIINSTNFVASTRVCLLKIEGLNEYIKNVHSTLGKYVVKTNDFRSGAQPFFSTTPIYWGWNEKNRLEGGPPDLGKIRS